MLLPNIKPLHDITILRQRVIEDLRICNDSAQTIGTDVGRVAESTVRET